MTTPSLNGWIRPGSSTFRLTGSSNCFPGCGSSQRQATPGAHKSLSSTETKAPPSSPETRQSGSTNSITPAQEGQQLVRSLHPAVVWLTHGREPWTPETKTYRIRSKSELVAGDRPAKWYEPSRKYGTRGDS